MKKENIEYLAKKRKSMCGCGGEICERDECIAIKRCVCKHLGNNHPLNDFI